jgi:multiple sugar transport system substrate-binding protein
MEVAHFMRKSLKRILTTAFATAISFSLVACGASTTDSNSAANSKSNGEAVNLRFMLWSPVQKVGYEQSIAQFEKLHPNIKVQIEQYPWAQYWQKLQTEMAAGDAPDLFTNHVTYFPTFVQNDQLLDLTPYIKKDKEDTSIYYPKLLKQYQYKGATYGLPTDWDTIAIFYNIDMFKKAGIPAPTNLTWNPQDGGTLLKTAKDMTVDANGKHPGESGFDPSTVKQYGFFSYNADQQFYYNFIAANGGKIIDKNFGKKILLNSPESVEALQNLVDMANKYHVSPPGSEGILPNGGANAEQMFQKGQVAMYTDIDTKLKPVVDGSKFQVGVALLPTGPAGRVSLMNGLSDAIYAHTKHPNEAWELEKWLASPESQKILASGGYVWPGIKSLTPLFADYWKKQGIDVTAFQQEANGKTVSYPITPNWGQASTEINNEFNTMWLGQASVKQATADAVQKANSALSGQ